MESQDNQAPGANDATLVAPRTQQASARLILRRPDGQLQEYGLEKDEITIGRLSTNDVVLSEDRSVSRRHAIIRRSNVGYVIEDQQSNNGTYVDGEKILYPFVLHNGQSIKIGSNELTFKLISGLMASQGGTGEPAPRPPTQPTIIPMVSQPAIEPSVPQPAPLAAPMQADYNAQPAPYAAPVQPEAFPQPPRPAFQQPEPPLPFQPPAQPQPVFQQSPAPMAQPPVPAYQQPEPPAPYQPPAQPMPAAPTQEIICQQCGQPTMANKQFCLQCGASIVGQLGQGSAPDAGPAPFGPVPGQVPGYAQPAPGSGPGGGFSQQPAQPGWPQPPQSQPAQPQSAWPQPAQPQPAWPQQQPQSAWPQPQPAQPQPAWPAQPQAWPGQPGQFGVQNQQAQASASPVEATAFFARGMRPLQTGDIRVRLAMQFAAPGGLQPGTTITVRVWPAAQDAFYLGGPGINLSVPGPGGVAEGALQVTPLRPTPPGGSDQLLLMITDAATGQPLQPNPVAAEIVIAYQPTPPFDGPGSVRIL
jgi:hypothetical protein